ncbi:MAG: class I SAM-dependent methyltransferase [Gammaproteobacteria bacterium]
MPHTPSDVPASWRQDQQISAELLGHSLRFDTTWGLFSPKQIDEGTLLLLDHLEVSTDTRCLDLGCGYGPIGLSVAAAAPSGHVTLLDKDFVAVEYASRNAGLNGLTNTEVKLSNGLSAVHGQRFDLLVSNIPAKVGKEMLGIMLYDAWQALEPGGRIVLVTINGLRQYMKRVLGETFGNYDKVKQGRSYTISAATRE